MKKILSVLVITILFSTSLFAQNKQFGFGGGIASPAGDMGDIFKSGFGGTATFVYPLSKSLLLTGTVGYYTFDMDENYFNDRLITLNVTTTVEVDAPISIIPIMAGIKYTLASGKIKPYLSAELGFHAVSLTAQSVTANGKSYDIQQEASETKTAWGFGAGLMIGISKNIDLDINAKFNGNGVELGQSQSTTTTTGSSTTTISESSSSTATFLTISAGILFNL